MSIVCATDFSPCSLAAEALAARLSRQLGQPILLVHAVQAPTGGAAPAPATMAEWTVALSDAAAARLEAEATALRATGVAVTTELTFGAPGSQLVDLAAAREAEAIVIGTHGRAGLSRLLLGSVAEQVVRRAGRPVFVAHAEPGPTPSGSLATSPQRLVVVTDGGPTDAAALAWAAQWSERAGCEVLVIRLVSPEIDAARFGVDRPWEGDQPSTPLIEAASCSLARALLPFPGLVEAPRRFFTTSEATAGETCLQLDGLSASLLVVALPSARHRDLPRALRPATLLRGLRTPVVCIPAAPAAAQAMPSVEAILVAVDLEDPAPTALLSAYGLLKHWGGRVELCYVHAAGRETFGNTALAPPLSALERSALEERLRRMIPATAEAAGIVTHVHVLEGISTAEAIAQAVARLGTDLVVLATHDRRGLRRLFAGSVTDEVLHATSSPTLVVRA